MNNSGPLLARLRAFRHMLRRPGHRVASYYVARRLMALHCLDCQRAFYGRVVQTSDTTRHWSVSVPVPKD